MNPRYAPPPPGRAGKWSHDIPHVRIWKVTITLCPCALLSVQQTKAAYVTFIFDPFTLKNGVRVTVWLCANFNLARPLCLDWRQTKPSLMPPPYRGGPGAYKLCAWRHMLPPPASWQSSQLFARWHLFQHVGYLRYQHQVDLWPSTFLPRKWCPSHLWRTWAISVPILVFLSHSVLDLGPMYATDRCTSDRQRQTSDKSIA